jgi:hypothetical protein
MAHVTGHFDESALLSRPTAELGRLSSRSLMLGAIGAVGIALGLVTFGDHFADAFWQSYLIGYIFWIGITLGALGILMIQHLTGGAWTMISRRVLEACTRTLPLMAVLFVPIVLNMDRLYPWVNPDPNDESMQHVLHLKGAYLNEGFFVIRALLYFVIWFALAFFLNKWSREQDERPAELPGPLDRRSRVLSGPGLVLYVATITFMSVDWVMSLDPHWYSTIFGVLMLGGQGLSTMAFTIIVLAMLVRFRPMSEVATPDNFHDHGKLMFAFLMLWAYFSVSQLLIIWSANLPEEIPFYLERLHGPWYPISVALLLGQFALPFLILLSQNVKRNPDLVKWVAAFILVMRIVDITWTIGPVFRHEGSGLSWLDFAVALAMGGVWLFLFFRTLAGRAIVPARDPYFKEAVAHGGH